jgi:glucosamine-6-phosphate deaminase
MDEFCDAGMSEEFTCTHQLRSQLYDKVSPGRVHSLLYNPSDPESEARRFEQVLREEDGIDVLCQGIGTSGHLAFNEPDKTDFRDERWVRVVDICEQSKRQLAEDPNFEKLGYIPEKGITMTLPALLSAKSIFTIVPLGLKRPILTRLFDQPAPTTALPASILSTVEGTLYVDKNSCPVRFL